MRSLAEIIADVEQLPREERLQLLRLLLQQLRADPATLPEPRKFTRQQIEEWVGRDEENMRRFQAGD